MRSLPKSYNGPTVTKDSVTVAKEIELEDHGRTWICAAGEGCYQD